MATTHGLPTPDLDLDLGCGKREIPEEVLKTLPGKARSLAAAIQPVVPHPVRFADHTLKAVAVAADTVVIDVAANAPDETDVLLPYR